MTPLISLSANDEGNILTIRDITAYTSPARSEVALIVGWSKDAFVADWNLDFSDPIQGEWNEMISNGYDYSVFMFACYLYSYSLNVDFGEKAIVSEGGNFYIKYTAALVNFTNGGSPTFDPANWVLLSEGTSVIFESDPLVTVVMTIEDIYGFIRDSIANTEPIGIIDGIIQVNFPSVFLEKMSCHSWRVRNNCTKVLSAVSLLKYDYTLVRSYLGADTVDIDIDVDGDGVYVVHVLFDADVNGLPDANSSTVEYPLIDFCDALECYTNLFKYTMCVCDDPCSPSEDCGEKLSLKLRDMNTIREIISTVLMMTELSASQNIGVYGIMDSSKDYLLDIGLLLAKLKIVTSRCGLCGNDTLGNIDC